MCKDRVRRTSVGNKFPNWGATAEKDLFLVDTHLTLADGGTRGRPSPDYLSGPPIHGEGSIDAPNGALLSYSRLINTADVMPSASTSRLALPLQLPLPTASLPSPPYPQQFTRAKLKAASGEGLTEMDTHVPSMACFQLAVFLPFKLELAPNHAICSQCGRVRGNPGETCSGWRECMLCLPKIPDVAQGLSS